MKIEVYGIAIEMLMATEMYTENGIQNDINNYKFLLDNSLCIPISNQTNKSHRASTTYTKAIYIVWIVFKEWLTFARTSQ